MRNPGRREEGSDGDDLGDAHLGDGDLVMTVTTCWSAVLLDDKRCVAWLRNEETNVNLGQCEWNG
jgi:hypothetical protein